MRKRIIVSILILLAASAIAFTLYVKARHIHEIVKERAAYVLVIGSSKQEVIDHLSKMEIWYYYNKNPENHDDLFINSSDIYSALANLEKENIWSFFYDKNHMDLLRLFFSEGRLKEILRNRKFFEFP
ncbi:MAG: hypothetical protein RRA15_09020 [bacterium]|nr:hypothetical protein [bacterium]MDT8366623.1 hypothetical protein [bacterium]